MLRPEGFTDDVFEFASAIVDVGETDFWLAGLNYDGSVVLHDSEDSKMSLDEFGELLQTNDLRDVLDGD